MTLRGHIQNGALVLTMPVGLPDGTNVEVEVRPLPDSPESEPTWGEVFRDLAGTVTGLPTDMARNHDHYIHGTAKRTDAR
jgi:hypothetical protein